MKEWVGGRGVVVGGGGGGGGWASRRWDLLAIKPQTVVLCSQ